MGFDLKRLFRRVGADPAVEEIVVSVLEERGYDPKDERDLALGMVALIAAGDVCAAAGGEPETLPRKLGRNDPCPCGSGRKYKKCCEGLGEMARPNPSRSGRHSPLETPDVIPQLSDEDKVMEDLEALADLLQADESLSTVRFSHRKVAEFVGRITEGRDPGEAPPEGRDEIALRYTLEVEKPGALGNLRGRFVRAASGLDEEWTALRALATGVAMIDAVDPKACTEEAPHPVVSLVFWATVEDLLDALEQTEGEEGLREQLPGGEDLDADEVVTEPEGADLDDPARPRE